MSKLATWKKETPIAVEHSHNPFLRLQNEVDRVFSEFNDFFHLLDSIWDLII